MWVSLGSRESKWVCGDFRCIEIELNWVFCICFDFGGFCEIDEKIRFLVYFELWEDC